MKLTRMMFVLIVVGLMQQPSLWAAEVAKVDEKKDSDIINTAAEAQPAQQVASFPVDNLKGTLTCLPKELQTCSIATGAIANERGVVQRLYDFGPIRLDPEPYIPHLPRKPADGSTQDEQAKYENDKKAYNEAKEQHKKWVESIESPSIKLVRKLFYRIPGSLDSIGFDVTSGLKKMAPKNVAKTVAKTISGLLIHQKVATMLEPLKLSAEQTEILLPEIILGELSSQCDIKKQNIKEALKDPIFPGYEVVGSALLAALWERCKNDREALSEYYKEFKKELDNQIKSVQNKINKQKKMFSSDTNIQETIQSAVNQLQLLVTSIKIPTAEVFDHSPKEIDALRKKVASYKPEDLDDPTKLEEVEFLSLVPEDQPDDLKMRHSTLVFNGQFPLNNRPLPKP